MIRPILLTLRFILFVPAIVGILLASLFYLLDERLAK